MDPHGNQCGSYTLDKMFKINDKINVKKGKKSRRKILVTSAYSGNLLYYTGVERKCKVKSAKA